MSDFSSLTGKFRIRKEAGGASRRPRESQACTQCRKAKLRCDLQRPCGSCMRKDETALCSYQRTLTGPNQSDTAEDRLAHLESLVKGLMQDSTSASSKPSVDHTIPLLEGQSNDCDPRVSFQATDGENRARYVGSTHWSAILDDIQGLRAALSQQDDSPEPDPASRSSAIPAIGRDMIIFGSSSNYSMETIISQYLPPKIEVDRLLAIYFQGETFIIPFIHTFQFQRQYRAFWEDPIDSNPLWLSMLFSICSAASMVRGTIGIAPTTQEDTIAEVSHFQEAAGKCLVKGEYHRPQRYVLEALTLYAHCINMQSLDPSREVGAIFGMIVRMAYEMGYHRDPDSLGSGSIMSVFEGEMRRRFWALCIQIDLMVSFQLGLPSNICPENCDTRSPRNLSDSDFDEDTQILPPSRSETEAIGLLWFIVKDRQMVSFGKVCRDTLSFTEKSETEILQLDGEIRRMYTTIPEILRTRPLADSISDPPFLVMTRIYVEFIYLKSLCVFHRKYMTRGNLFSTRSCVEAGQRLVSQFIDIYREFSSGGQLHRERWMLTNFTMNDFLLGAMVLCLAIHIRRKNLEPGQSVIDPTTADSILSLLSQAHAICIEKSLASRDARYVAQAIMATLNKQNQESTSTEAKSRAPPSMSHSEGDPFYLGWLDPFQAGDEGVALDWSWLDWNPMEVVEITR
ncbi:hypothetical protein N7509_009809 [Penicillium cosmopolitanum]|uniref:Zn(2)-C6 fungal-type domain-containing protein n=1 Tax=Penicillium cosmopolitanum TaxID=1131564 RepID=A0A9W9VQ58_9EURO|nr:uncharacterized protein N7509_009809 [Penicillium cosmopolitanum]KAJ5387268.1 hypothetical protein N7509_009809 [Penicillium cosmopolitanum]